MEPYAAILGTLSHKTDKWSEKEHASPAAATESARIARIQPTEEPAEQTARPSETERHLKS